MRKNDFKQDFPPPRSHELFMFQAHGQWRPSKKRARDEPAFSIAPLIESLGLARPARPSLLESGDESGDFGCQRYVSEAFEQ